MDDIVGRYTCTVTDYTGSSDEKRVSFAGNQDKLLLIVMHFYCSGTRVETSSDIFFVGSSESVTCSSDLDVASIEWLYEGDVVASSSVGSVKLNFDPVTESIHEREYTCRISTVHGVVEHNVTIFVASEYSGRM